MKKLNLKFNLFKSKKPNKSLSGLLTIIICIIVFVGAIFAYNKFEQNKKNTLDQKSKQGIILSDKDFINDFQNLPKKEASQAKQPQNAIDKYNAQIEVSKKAIEDNKPSQEKFKDLSDDYAIIAFNYYILGDYKISEEWQKKLLEKWPDNYKAMLNLGDLYIMMGQYQESAKYFYQATKAYPETDLAYIKLADLYTKFATNNKDKASMIYEDGINHANYKRALLKAYASYLELYKKDYQKAILIWREYEKVSGDKAEQEIQRIQQKIQ